MRGSQDTGILRKDSRMRDEAGNWLAPSPPWPIIGKPGTHNLPEFIAPFETGFGRLVLARKAFFTDDR